MIKNFMNIKSLYSLLFEGEIKPMGGEIIVNKVYADLLEYKKNNSNPENAKPLEKIYEIPVKDILELDSEEILIGSIFFVNLNVRNSPRELEVADRFFDSKTKKFEQSYLEDWKQQLNNIKVEIKVVFTAPNDSRSGAFASFTKRLTKNASAMVYINAFEHDSFSTLEHEFRHGTEKANNLCLTYSKVINSGHIKEPSQIREIIDPPVQSFGTGKKKIGWAYVEPGNEQSKAVTKKNISKFVKSEPEGDEKLSELLRNLLKKGVESPSEKISDEEYTHQLIQYLGADAEYSSWKGDLLQSIMNYVQNNPQINQILTGLNNSLAAKSSNVRSQAPVADKISTVRSQAPKERRTNLEEDLSQQQTSSELASSEGIVDLSNKLIRSIIDNREILRTIDVRGDAYDFFIDVMLKLRPTEFLNSLTKDLAIRMKNYAKQKGLTYLVANTESQTQTKGKRSDASLKQREQNIQKQKQAQQQSQQQRQQIQATAKSAQELEAEFRSSAGVIPRNPRKHSPEQERDTTTGRKIVEPEIYRQKFEKWKENKKTFGGRMKNFFGFGLEESISNIKIEKIIFD